MFTQTSMYTVVILYNKSLDYTPKSEINCYDLLICRIQTGQHSQSDCLGP